MLAASASLSAPGVHASSTYVLDGRSPGALYESTLGCAGIGGSWSNLTVTCEISGNGTLSSGGRLTLDPSAALVIDYGATLSVSGLVLENGSKIANTGTMMINATGTVDNSGTFSNNYGTVVNSGYIINRLAGTIDNYGIIINDFGGTLNNTGTVSNTSLIDDTAGATIDNTGVIANLNGSTIANSGTVNNSPAGAIDNTGVVSDGCGGIITNPARISGNPVVNTCVSPKNSGSGATSTVPEFPMAWLGALAFAILAAAVLLLRGPRRARGSTKVLY